MNAAKRHLLPFLLGAVQLGALLSPPDPMHVPFNSLALQCW